MENQVSDLVTQVTLLVDEVEELKDKIPEPATCQPSPPTSTPTTVAPDANPASAPAGPPPTEPPALAEATSPPTTQPSESATGWQTAGKKRKQPAKEPTNPNRAAWLYVCNGRRGDGKLTYQARDNNWQRHLASLLPKGSDLLQGVRKVDNDADTRLTLACTTRAARAALLAVLCSSSSVKAFPHLLQNEKAGRQLAANTARRFGVRLVPRGD